MENCVFCEIVEGTVPASIVYADKIVCVFMTIEPINPGHLLVVPKKHYPSLSDLDEEVGSHMFKITMRMARAIRHAGVRCEGINLFLADGEAAFQDVFHIHMHVFPRFEGDPFKLDINLTGKPGRKELDAIATDIRRADELLQQADPMSHI